MRDASIRFDHLTLGVCYYPEHWDEALWGEDLERMAECGIEVVRVFEFAWSVVEREEGVFDYSLFDRFLALAQAKKMQVILCTPTATPPAWLTKKYPESLNADKLGHRFDHGHRRQYNYNSPEYLRLCERIVTKLAERYGEHPAVIGWQIDNEINCEVSEFYSEADHAAFSVYLRDRFVSLENLNDAIGARFWSQTYTDWEEIRLSANVPGDHGNPHLELLMKRFISVSARRFVKLQSDVLRKHAPGRFVTTNGLFGHLDNHEMTQESLNFITYDSYPNFAYGEGGINAVSGAEVLRDRVSGMRLTLARSISANFGIMEQQSGAGGWDFRMLQPMPKPGQMRLWTMQSVAHGADFVSYFRWRTCSFGTEIYWHGLLDYDNRPNRRIAELKRISADFARMGEMAGSRYVAKVGILSDYLNEWDGERDRWHGPLDQRSRLNLFAAAQTMHIPLDLVYIRNARSHRTELDELSRYDVLIYPHATILTSDTAELLRTYVEAGGILVMGARTGYKDEFGRCPMRPMPGFAAELCGVTVEDYSLSRHADSDMRMIWDGETVSAPDFNDVLEPAYGGVTEATFIRGYFKGKPAIVKKDYPVGGAAYYVGGGFGMDTAALIYKKLGVAEPYGRLVSCPKEVELAVREKEGKYYFLLLNYVDQEMTVTVNKAMEDLLTGEKVSGEITLSPYGVTVLKTTV